VNGVRTIGIAAGVCVILAGCASREHERVEIAGVIEVVHQPRPATGRTTAAC
jgi:hypothetical protein